MATLHTLDWASGTTPTKPGNGSTAQCQTLPPPLASPVNSEFSLSAVSVSASDVTDKSIPPGHEDFYTVSWDGPEDPANPKNWTKGRKWTTSLIISSFAFLSPLCSSITAPALSSIGHDLHIPFGAELQLVLSIFLLAYAIGPFVLSPCSEVWGRVPVIRFGNMVFILFTALCGAATSQSQITAFRFLAGLGGSASVGMGSGVLTDCWRPEERGKGIAVYQLTQVLGPAVGPIAGGYISQYASWRWCFFIIVFANITVQAIAFFFLQETYAPRLLQDKARRLREKTGNPMLRTEWEQSDENRTFLDLLLKALSRPWVMLGTQPIVQVLAVYQAFNFGVLYLLISGFPALWEDRYGMPRGDASLNYLSLAIGSLVGVTVCGPATDAVYAALKRRRGISDDQPGVPEFRMPLVIPVSIISPAAIFLYGWAAQEKLHWIFPNIGAAIFSGSSIVCYQCISAYLADTYNLHSASASSACAFLRSILAFAFPLFVPALFGNLGYGVGGSIIGVVAIVVGVPAPWIIWFYGPRMRGASQFAGTGLSSARKAAPAFEKV